MNTVYIYVHYTYDVLLPRGYPQGLLNRMKGEGRFLLL